MHCHHNPVHVACPLLNYVFQQANSRLPLYDHGQRVVRYHPGGAVDV